MVVLPPEPAPLKLQGNDGQDPVEVPFDVACRFGTIKNMLMTDDDDDPDYVITISEIRTPILIKAIEWATQHKDDVEEVEREEADGRRAITITDWDKNFMNVQESEIFELTLAATYLDIEGLLNLTCKYIADMISGKSPEEIRQRFGIVNDLTPEQMQQIIRENDCVGERN